ncbi:hypothetical protein LXL04_002035 [Taraxacum kok-saghyz]
MELLTLKIMCQTPPAFMKLSTVNHNDNPVPIIPEDVPSSIHPEGQFEPIGSPGRNFTTQGVFMQVIYRVVDKTRTLAPSWVIKPGCLYPSGLDFIGSLQRSLVKATAPSLSQKISRGSTMPGTTPRSPMKFFSQTASLAASHAAMYSDSHVESATVSCLELFHVTAPPLSKNTHPD